MVEDAALPHLTYRAWSTDESKVDAWVADDGRLYLAGKASTWATAAHDPPVSIMAKATDGGGLESEEFELVTVRVHARPEVSDNIRDVSIPRSTTPASAGVSDLANFFSDLDTEDVGLEFSAKSSDGDKVGIMGTGDGEYKTIDGGAAFLVGKELGTASITVRATEGLDGVNAHDDDDGGIGQWVDQEFTVTVTPPASG